MTPSHASSFSIFFFIDFVFVIKVKFLFLFFSVADLAVRFVVFSTFYIFLPVFMVCVWFLQLCGDAPPRWLPIEVIRRFCVHLS